MVRRFGAGRVSRPARFSRVSSEVLSSQTANCVEVDVPCPSCFHRQDARDSLCGPSEPRFSTGDDAIFQELSPLSLDRQEVRIVDVSRNGLRVPAAKSVFLGTIVQIQGMSDRLRLHAGF